MNWPFRGFDAQVLVCRLRAGAIYQQPLDGDSYNDLLFLVLCKSPDSIPFLFFTQGNLSDVSHHHLNHRITAILQFLTCCL